MMVVPLHTKGVNDDGYFYGYASVFSVVDHDGDILIPGAFQETLQAWAQKEQKPDMLWQHAPNVNLGSWTDVAEDDYGLAVKGQLNFSLSSARHVHQLIRRGEVKGLSIGFLPLNTIFHQGYRHIHRVDLREISIVTEACNRMACITHHSTTYI